MVKLNIAEALNAALAYEMEKDKNVLVLGEDVGKDGGVFRITQGLFEKFGEDRVIDTPLAESGIVGTSIGLAMSGFKPVAEIQFDGFIYPAFDQLICHAARLRNRSRGLFSVPMVVRAPYGGGIRAPEHHSESMEALYVHTPGLKVVIPSNPADAKGLLIASIRDPDTVVFLEPKKIYRAFKADVPEGEYIVPLGKAAITKEGKDLSIISYGAMIPLCLEAAAEMEKKGISVEVVDLRTLSPLDTETIIASVKKTGKAVVVHEGPRICGMGAEIIAQINDYALDHLHAPVARVTGYDIIPPLAKLEDYYIPDVRKILMGIKKVLEY